MKTKITKSGEPTIKECTNIDIEEIERLSKIIKFLETHVQVKGEWIKK